MARINGYECDVCKKVGKITRPNRYPYYEQYPKGWWSITPLGQNDDPEVCSLDCMIAWAEKEKKKPKKKAKPKAQASRKKVTRRR